MTAPAAVVALGAFRGCEHGHGIRYDVAMDGAGPAAVRAALAAAERAGTIHPADLACDGHFAVLDLLDEVGDEVADHCIPTREAWEWWQRGATFTATASDCRTCEPEAWAAVYGPGGAVERSRRERGR